MLDILQNVYRNAKKMIQSPSSWALNFVISEIQISSEKLIIYKEYNDNTIINQHKRYQSKYEGAVTFKSGNRDKFKVFWEASIIDDIWGDLNFHLCISGLEFPSLTNIKGDLFKDSINEIDWQSKVRQMLEALHDEATFEYKQF